MAHIDHTNVNDSQDSPSMTELTMVLEPSVIPLFFIFLRKGVGLKVRVGCSVRELICRQLGVRSEYLDHRVQTVFLDGKPVDDVDTAIVNDGTTLALSASMPGLAGATLRKAGFFAKLRSQISHTEDMPCASSKKGRVVLKIFNLLTSEMGPDLLGRGVYIRKEDLEDLFHNNKKVLQAGCQSATINGENIDLNTSIPFKGLSAQVLLKVHARH